MHDEHRGSESESDASESERGFSAQSSALSSGRVALRPQSFEIDIEELVLYGLPPGDRYRIAGSVKQELERVFRDRGIPPSLVDGGEISRVDGGSFEIGPDSRAETLGRQIAQALYRTWQVNHALPPCP